MSDDQENQELASKRNTVPADAPAEGAPSSTAEAAPESEKPAAA